MGIVDLGIRGIEGAEEYARGGFAVVYRAHQTTIDRQVAVKVLGATGLSAQDRERFLGECRALGRVSDHPSIVTVYDGGFTSDGRAYVVMQFVGGGSLEDQIARGPMPPHEVTRLGAALGSALDAAHHVGVLHLDVKPGNVLLDRYGNPLLADFGIARLLDSHRVLTHQTIAGTPGFIAPELLDGTPATVQSDVYELGATLYALATGTAPYHPRPGEGVWQLLARIDREPPPPLPSTLPPALCGVIDRAMSRAPADRYTSCGELAAALSASTNRGSLPAPRAAPTSPVEHVLPRPPSPPGGARVATLPTPVPPARSSRRRVGVTVVLGLAAAAVATVLLVARPGDDDDAGSGDAGLGQTTTAGPEESVDATSSAVSATTAPNARATGASSTIVDAPTTIGSVAAASTTTPSSQAPESPAVALTFDLPRGLALGEDGAIYVVESGAGVVRRIAPDGTSSSVVGTGIPGFGGDGGPTVEAQLSKPEGIAVGPDGTLFISDLGNHRVRMVTPDGIISTIAGNGTEGFGGDGSAATDVGLDDPIHIDVAPDGSIVFAENKTNRLRRIEAGVLETVAGTEPDEAKEPQGIAALDDGSIVFSDTFHHQVKIAFPDGTIGLIAGTGVQGDGGDGGPSSAAQLSSPVGVDVAADGTILVADYGNSRIRRINLDGTISTVAGTGVAGYSGDGGAAVSAQLNEPEDVLALPDGTVVVSDTKNGVLRRIDAAGHITTLTTSASVASLTGSVARTCGSDGTGDCFVGVHAVPNYETPNVYTIDEGVEVGIVCQVRGQDVRSSVLDASSDVWVRLTDGNYVAAVFIDSPQLDPFLVSVPC